MSIIDTMQTHVHETQFQLELMRDVFWTPSFVEPVDPNGKFTLMGLITSGGWLRKLVWKCVKICEPSKSSM